MTSVTFVVQGPMHPSMAACLSSIRFHYPESKIVISTWKSEITSKLDCDQLILNDDPGGVDVLKGFKDNVNRQIVSTSNGLAKVTTPYAVKMRSDCLLVDRKLQLPIEKASLFRNKITALNLYFRDPITSGFLFHPGDIFQFGRTEDLRSLWQVPLSEFEQPRKGLKAWLLNESIFKARRYVPEQYIWVSFLRKSSLWADIGFPLDYDPEQFEMSERSIAQNFVVKTYDELGLHIPSHLIGHNIKTVYTAAELQEIRDFGPRVSRAHRTFLRRRRRALWGLLLHPKNLRR